MSGSRIPVIDISPALRGGDVGGIAAQLDAACRGIGFLQIVGHGVDPQLYHDLYRAAEPLWSLPEDQREALRSPHAFRGLYTDRDADGAMLTGRFQANRFQSPEDALALGVDARYVDWCVPNPWPADETGVRAAHDRLFRATRGLGFTMMNLVAVALGIPDGALDRYFDLDASYLAVHAYPSVPSARAGDTRVPQHSDSGLLTMLHQSGNYEGLELCTAAGELLTVPVIDEALVVNIGDLMARWTNDQWLATPHRVVSGGPGEARVSVATHYLPNLDAVIEPLPTCVTAGAPTYEPITPYDWDRRYFEKPSLVLRVTDGEAVGATAG
jgi:isopenicillin N synthase-like dioxygenase